MSDEICKASTLKHYDKMINQALLFPQDELPSRLEMNDSIGETWNADCCEYCHNFFEESREYHNMEFSRFLYIIAEYSCEMSHNMDFINFRACSKCPLSSFLNYCCGGLWQEMSDSKTWREWIIAAKEVREFINING